MSQFFLFIVYKSRHRVNKKFKIFILCKISFKFIFQDHSSTLTMLQIEKVKDYNGWSLGVVDGGKVLEGSKKYFRSETRISKSSYDIIAVMTASVWQIDFFSLYLFTNKKLYTYEIYSDENKHNHTLIICFQLNSTDLTWRFTTEMTSSIMV